MRITNVLYLLRDDLENLPPSMSQVLTLCKLGCNVKIVSMRTSKYIKEFYKDQSVEFLSLYDDDKKNSNIVHKIKGLLDYRSLVEKSLEKEKYELLWIGSGDTARYCKDLLVRHKAPIVLNIYELYDKNPEVIRAIKPIAQDAECVVVPEYNRAHILKVWLSLKKTPIIIPNKPCFPKVEILAETQELVNTLKALNKRIVLYQGWIGRGRDVTKVAEALNKLDNKDEYALVLLGNAVTEEAIDEVRSNFDTTIHIPFLKPPQHLFITEQAHMGIATYDDSSLNNIFCAPNKIYEYAEKGVPILARDIPGLSSTVGKYNAGICVDMDSADDIADAILKISSDHNAYVEALKSFLDECGVEQSIKGIIENCEEAYSK